MAGADKSEVTEEKKEYKENMSLSTFMYRVQSLFNV